MSLDEETDRSGGRWVKLNEPGDRIAGTLVGAIDTQKIRTDPENNPVLSRKTGVPRKVYGIVVRVDESEREDSDDDLLRRFNANEAAQWAIKDAWKLARTNGLTSENGAKFLLEMTAQAPDKFSQAEYRAKFAAGDQPAPQASAVAVEDPF